MLRVIKEDPDEDPILEWAEKAKPEVIVSEDKDLLRLGQYGSAWILTMGDFIWLTPSHGHQRTTKNPLPGDVSCMCF